MNRGHPATFVLQAGAASLEEVAENLDDFAEGLVQ